MIRTKWQLILALGILFVVSCSGQPGASSSDTTPPTPTSTSAPATTAVVPSAATPAPAAATAGPAVSATAPGGAAGSSSTLPAGTTLYVLQPGSEAQYKVHEQLASRSLPSDAIGKTQSVSGSLAIQADGTLIPDQSHFVIDLRTLKSDENRRDNYIQKNTLETSKYPNAEFVARAIRGLPSPLPTSGAVKFELDGDLTVHGVTHPVTWQVTGTADGNTLNGTATTVVHFGDFNMTQPKVFVVLTVEDNIQLELDFHFQKTS